MKRRFMFFLALLTLLSLTLPALAGAETELDLTVPGLRIGVATGSIQEQIVRELCPEAEVFHFEKVDGCTAVAQGKIDCYIYDKRQLEIAVANGQAGIRVLDQTVGDSFSVALGISDVSKIPDLADRVNAFIASIREDGTLDEIFDRWVIRREEDMPEIPLPSSPKYHLTVGTTGIVEPYSYFKGSELMGYDIELAYRLAAWLEADVSFDIYDYGSIVAACHSGKADIISANLQVTPERAEALRFSDPLFRQESGIIVRTSDLAAPDTENDVPADGDRGKNDLLSGIAASFEKTFIRENRWKLFLQGVWTTLLITMLSILFGTMLGFLVFMLCRNGNRAANAITRAGMWLVQGMPMVVLLMILYYVIFGSVSISGITVAVIGFTLTFGAAVFGLLKTGVGAVDPGQYEAAYALGHSNRRTFYRVILPQAIPHVLPAYRGEIVSLLKATAVVGYIAVQDLTKMGDIVRSRTYEAFFPLIAVTVIYFALEGIMNIVLRRIQKWLDPKKRSKEHILKGVKTDD